MSDIARLPTYSTGSSVTIPLGDGFLLEWDSLNFTLLLEATYEKGKNVGQMYHKILGHYTTLSGASWGVLRHGGSQASADSLDGLLSYLQTLSDTIERQLKNLNLGGAA